MSKPGRVKRVLFRLLAILLSLMVVEVALRAYDVACGRSVRARGQWYWAFEQDRFLGYQHRPNVDITLTSGTRMDPNSEGFRDEEIPITSAEPRRLVICIGESSTWGLGAKDRLSTWPKKMEAILKKSDPSFKVLNAALPGYSMVESLQLTQLRLLKYKPEAIVCMGMRNDFRAYAGCLKDDVDFNNYRRIFAELPRTPGNELMMRSSLITAIVTPFRGKLDGAFYPTSLRSKCTPRGEALYRDQVALLSELCRRHDIRLLFVDQPIDYSDDVGLKLRPGFEHLRQVQHDELKKQKVTLLKANSIYNYSEFPLKDDVHFTAAGIDHMAELLAPQVLAELGDQ